MHYLAHWRLDPGGLLAARAGASSRASSSAVLRGRVNGSIMVFCLLDEQEETDDRQGGVSGMGRDYIMTER